MQKKVHEHRRLVKRKVIISSVCIISAAAVATLVYTLSNSALFIERKFMRAKEMLTEEFSGAYHVAGAENGNVVEVTVTADMGMLEIVEGYETAVWRYNGAVPGPEIRIQHGDTVRILFNNNLPQASTIHFHGIRLPNIMDGVPRITQDAVLAGNSFVYEFTPKDAGTFWFHPHENTSEQLERGLYGTLIVEDEYSEQYSQDVVWVIDDWRLTEDYQIYQHFVTPHDVSHDGRWGNVITVNSSLDETLHAQPGERVRLRLVNAANGRVFRIDFRGLQPSVIAVDGLYVKETFHANGFDLAPGNRVDIDITIPDDAHGRSFSVYDIFTRNTIRLGNIVVAGDTVDTPSFAHPINHNIPDWSEAINVPVDVEYALDARRSAAGSIEWTINGQTFSQHNPIVLRHGVFNKIRFTNRSARLHPMHLHGQFFKVISRNGQPTDERYFRDTVLIHSRETVDVGMVPLDRGRWVNHCHIAEHADAGMMTSIRVQ